MFDVTKMWEEFEERVAAAPLVTEADLKRLAYELLLDHCGMIDAVLADAERATRDEPHGGEAVAGHIHRIRQELDEFGVLEFKLHGLQRAPRTRSPLQ